jgi:DnaK suppressor protein
VDPDRLRRTFAARRRQLTDELARLTERPADPVGNLSFGKRIGDGTNEAVDRINTTAAARSIAASIAELDRAAAKLDEGTYGRCDRCGRSIPLERLEARPWTSRCVECSRLGDSA